MISSVRTWIQKFGLELNTKHKTEAVLVSRRRKVESIKIDLNNKKNTVRGHVIQSNTHIRYLRVVLDHRLNFKHHKQVGKQRV